MGLNTPLMLHVARRKKRAVVNGRLTRPICSTAAIEHYAPLEASQDVMRATSLEGQEPRKYRDGKEKVCGNQSTILQGAEAFAGYASLTVKAASLRSRGYPSPLPSPRVFLGRILT